MFMATSRPVAKLIEGPCNPVLPFPALVPIINRSVGVVVDSESNGNDASIEVFPHTRTSKYTFTPLVNTGAFGGRDEGWWGKIWVPIRLVVLIRAMAIITWFWRWWRGVNLPPMRISRMPMFSLSKFPKKVKNHLSIPVSTERDCSELLDHSHSRYSCAGITEIARTDLYGTRTKIRLPKGSTSFIPSHSAGGNWMVRWTISQTFLPGA